MAYHCTSSCMCFVVTFTRLRTYVVFSPHTWTICARSYNSYCQYCKIHRSLNDSAHFCIVRHWSLGLLAIITSHAAERTTNSKHVGVAIGRFASIDYQCCPVKTLCKISCIIIIIINNMFICLNSKVYTVRRQCVRDNK